MSDTADWIEQEFQSIYVQCLQAQIKLVVELESKLDANLADVERGWVERDLLQLFSLVDSDKDGKLHREELTAVFREKGPKFLKLCDFDKDGFVDIAEWVRGIMPLVQKRGDSNKVEYNDFKKWKREVEKLILAAISRKTLISSQM